MEGTDFFVAHKGSDGKRKTQSFSKYNKAKLEAENLVVKIHNGTLDTLKLTGAELRSHEHAAQLAAELRRPVDSIVQEFKEAQE